MEQFSNFSNSPPGVILFCGMEDEDLLLFLLTMQAVGLTLFTAWKVNKRKRWRNRRWWVRPINTRRREQGDFATLFRELKEDPDLFFRYTRMTEEAFYELLHLVSPYITKRSARPSIDPEQRLAITLRYLATGDQVFSVALAYRIGESTAHNIIKETCGVIVDVLMPLYLKAPTEEEWKKIAADFLIDWNMPNCVGAIDGKHVVVQAPPNSGSLYFNYKKTFSIVLMAACDSKYKFTVCDVGSFGSENDGGILSRSTFGRALYDGKLNLPNGKAKLPGSNIELPCYFVADEAFQMSTNIMRPYPGRCLNEQKRIFNYRLSRARRTIENTFGILVSRWRIFRKSICVRPDVVDRIVMATICLHNFLKSKNDELLSEQQRYCPPQFTDHENAQGEIIGGEWRERIQNNSLNSIGNIGAHRATRAAYNMRDTLATYFLTPTGEIPWQYEYIRQGVHGDIV